jgi:hypothetical protein
MALFKPFRGTRTSLPQELHDGYAYFCTDDGSFHIDFTDAAGNLQRKQISEDFIKQLLNMTNDTGYLDAGKITEEGDETNA